MVKAEPTDSIVIYIPGQEGYPFSNGLARVSDNRYWRDVPDGESYEISEKFGYIDRKGRLLVPFLYEKAGDFIDGLAFVAARRLKNRSELCFSYIDHLVEAIIPLRFEGAKSFSEGMAPVKAKGKWGFIDKNGNIITEGQALYRGNVEELIYFHKLNVPYPK